MRGGDPSMQWRLNFPAATQYTTHPVHPRQPRILSLYTCYTGREKVSPEGIVGRLADASGSTRLEARRCGGCVDRQRTPTRDGAEGQSMAKLARLSRDRARRGSKRLKGPPSTPSRRCDRSLRPARPAAASHRIRQAETRQVRPGEAARESVCPPGDQGSSSLNEKAG